MSSLPQLEPAQGEFASAAPLFRLEATAEGALDLLRLEGEVGLDAAAELSTLASRMLAARRPIAVDWSSATRMSAAALQVLLALAAALESRGERLSVQADEPGIRRTLDLSGLSAHFRPLEETG